MNHFQTLLTSSAPTLATIHSTTQQQQQQVEQQQQEVQRQQKQSVIMNSTRAVVGEPSSSFISTAPDLHPSGSCGGGNTACCPSLKRPINEGRCGEVKEMNEHNVQKRIKRPMNAFMVWSQMRRAQIASTDVKMHNSQISKELGAEWREMSTEEKAPYVKKAKELREELMRRHPNYVYRPKRRSHGTTKNLLTKSCGILSTSSVGPTVPQQQHPPPTSTFDQRSHLSSLPTPHEIRRFFLARVMQEQQNNMLLAAYRNQLLAAAATTTTAAAATTTTAAGAGTLSSKDSANLDAVDQEKLRSTIGNFTTGNTGGGGGSISMMADHFNPISSLSMLQSPYNPINPLLGSQFNPFLFS